jgi:hypothetical protein
VNKTRHKWYLEENKNIHNDSIDTNDIETNDKSFTYQNIFDNNEIVKNISNIMSKKYKDIKKKIVSEKTHSSLENNLRPFKENIENIIIDKHESKDENKDESKDESKDIDKGKEQILIIEKYIENFTNLYNRKPLKEEIIDNMNDEINEKILKDYLDKCEFIDYSV